MVSQVMNFGYERGAPRVSLRTASESADVAHGINQKYLIKAPAHPVSDYNQFWNCINHESKWPICLGL